MATRGYTGPPADLQNVADNENCLTVMCQGCWHKGPTRTPQEWAAVFGVPMSSPYNDLKPRLRRTRCGARKAYFHIENGLVKVRR